MGYRSDLYVAIHKEDILDFKGLLSKHELDDEFSVINLNDDGSIHGDYFHYVAESLKWYTGYTDVDAINAFIASSERSSMCRIGEVTGDIQVINEAAKVSFTIKAEIDN